VTVPLLLEALRIVRLPGIDEPFAVESFSPGVNLVFGPNASGKSSIVRAIELLLWPPLHTRQLVTIAARFQLAGDTWDVRADADGTRAWCNSTPASAPALPSPELRHRYRISLHDLLGSESGDGGFAAAIARASVGGLDLASAASALEFSDRPPTRLSARNNWDANRLVLDEARQHAAALHREAQDLAELERARDDAGAAHQDIVRLEAIFRARTADTQYRDAEHALRVLPSGLGELTGREFDDAQSLLVQWRALVVNRVRARQQRDLAAQTMRELFPQRVPTEAERLAWRALASRLRDYDDRCERDTQSVRASEAERDHARQRCHGQATDAQLSQLDAAALDTLVTFARRFELAHGALLAANQLCDALSAIAANTALATALSADVLRDLMRVLIRWLAADARGSARATSAGVWWWLLLSVGVVGWVLLAVRWHWAAGFGAALALLIVLLSRRAIAPERTELTLLQHEYHRLGGAPLATWTSPDVSGALDSVSRVLADARARERDDARRADAERAVAQARAHLAPLEAERVALVARWGLAPDADAQTLPWFVHQLVTWSDAHRAVIALEARLDAAIATRAATYREMVASLAPHSIEVPESTSRIEAVIEALDARSLAFREASRNADDAERELQSLDADASGITTAWHTLLERASIAVMELPEQMQVVHEQQLRDTLDRLETGIAQRERFQELTKRCRDAGRDRDSAAAPFLADDAFHALYVQSPEELRCAHAEASARAAAYTELVERAATLRHRIDAAKRAHNVEGALARFDASSAELERAQQESLEALVGNAMLDFVHDETRDVHRPAVFHRARELFARITHGRWQLTLEENESGEFGFHAVDSRTLQECHLNQLSSGTRVQLLVAVRMAFVEVTEGPVRLPLFLDEALGTSDDQRAQALIEAALELAGTGRQLFYFTAQNDEMETWRTALTGRAIAWREFDLAQIRRGFDNGRPHPGSGVRVPPSPRSALPEPERHTHASYGAALHVPVIRAGFTPAAATHPWYVIDDVRVLHEVLSLGVATWGELQWYVDSRGRFPESHVSREECSFVLERARVLMRAVEVLHREARIGRGDPVDRTRLVEAGVTQPRLLDAVSAVATSCAGEARALLARLEDGAVSGFGPQRVTALRSGLQEIGCLDPATPRTAQEIRLAMLAEVSDDSGSGAVDALLARIAAAEG